MNHPCYHTSLPIGSLGSLQVHIPITTVGTGDPHLALLCGVHGDETAGLVIAHHFLQAILMHPEFQGRISIITNANPFAAATRSRVAPDDYLDLNRLGRGKPDGTLTERLAHALVSVLADCSFVIDLHEFCMCTPTLAIYIPAVHEETDHHILRGIAAFKPSFIWRLNLAMAPEQKYIGSLLAVLIQQGVPGFAIETSRLVELAPQHISETVDRLLEVSRFLGILPGTYAFSRPHAYIRHVMYSNDSGVWMPNAKLLAPTQQGATLGAITTMDLTSASPVMAHCNGMLIQYASTSMVQTGQSLFAIGQEDEQVTQKLRSVL